MSTKITAPVPTKGQVTSDFGPVRLVFEDGVATHEGDLSDGLRAYLAGNGYGIGSKKATAPDPAPEPPDPRTIDNLVVGTELRDAAVDPRPDDFLAPTNAGKANPHGPDVVSPEIHASQGVRPVKGGDVTFDGDVAAQSAAELDHTAAATDGTPVTLTDAEKADAAAIAGEADAGDLKGAALDEALEAAGLVKTGTADEKRTRLAEHQGQA